VSALKEARGELSHAVVNRQKELDALKQQLAPHAAALALHGVVLSDRGAAAASATSPSRRGAEVSPQPAAASTAPPMSRFSAALSRNWSQ
jgi:hypothetical protein